MAGNRRILDESSLVEKVAQYVLSEDGEFLRDALVEDLVDAVDSAQLALQDSASNFSRGEYPSSEVSSTGKRLILWS